MTDRTTELREKLTERGVEFTTDDFDHLLTTSWQINDVFARYLESIGDYVDEDDPTLKLKMNNVTPEQAIAATLRSEPPYDELLRCLENDWHISASWDGLRRFWNIELTEEGVRLRDEWNTRAERTCECVAEYAKSPIDGKTIVLHRCSACNELMRPHMNYCPNCGGEVREKAGNE